jgi:hypothetical protein
MRKTTSLLAATVVAALGAAPAAEAKTNVAVGMGDQNPLMFSDPNFQALKVKKVRYFIPWNAIRDPRLIADADAYVRAAKAARARVLFHISTDDFTPKKAKLPSNAQYKRDVGRLVRRYKAQGVKEWGVWNEANHKSQPTWDNPRRAAQFTRTMRSLCKGCTIVALDVLDQAGVDRYIQRFYAALPRSYRSLRLVVGLHNYSDTNRKRSRGTSLMIRTTKRLNKRARFWLTETGGVVNLGRSFPCDQRRAANRTAYMFTLAKKFDRDLERIYPYNWTGADCTKFDAGLTNADGTVRPAYTVFKSRARSFTR